MVSIESGMLVCVVGASGTGKDTLLRAAQSSMADNDAVRFVKRVITRPVDDDHEHHESVSEEVFKRHLQAGDFAVHWQAHGFYYGVPNSVMSDLAVGRVVVVNGSRAALPLFAKVFPRLKIVHVTVEADLLRQRLRLRGREDEKQINSRLARYVDNVPELAMAWQLDNSAAPEVAAERLIKFVVEQLD